MNRKPEQDAYLRCFSEVMPTARWKRVLEVYAGRAQAGDRYAVKFFADYMLGRPIERVVTKTERDANLDGYFSTLAAAVRDGNGDTDSG